MSLFFGFRSDAIAPVASEQRRITSGSPLPKTTTTLCISSPTLKIRRFIMKNFKNHSVAPERMLVLLVVGFAFSPVLPLAAQTITGAGTAGDIAKFTGPNSIGNSIIIENANKIGIGTGSPSSKLTVLGNTSNPIIFGKNSGTGVGVRAEGATGFGVIGKSSRTGVQGISTGSVGNGVWGDCSAGTGVLGSTAGGRGIYGNASGSGVGVFGKSGGGNGVE